MIYAIGLETRTMYAMGESKVDCLRELNAKYPSFQYQKANLKNTTRTVDKILPEPIQILRGK